MKDTLEKDNEALIAEMVRDAKVTNLPGPEPVVHRGDAELPSPMTMKEISGSGHVWVWDTRTFDKVPILYYMLPSKLKQRRLDGSFRFTTNDPGQLPKRGTNLCLLHVNTPNRQHYNELGFRVCPKQNITNPYQVTQHMKKKHPQEWAAIEEERRVRERQEDRELQRTLIGKAVAAEPAGTPEAPLYVSDKDKK